MADELTSIERISLADFDAFYEGEWVDINPKRPYSAARRIEGAAMRVVPQPDADLDALSSSTVDIILDPEAQGYAVLTWHVKAWSLRDEGGAALPADLTGFRHEDFDDELGDWLVDRIGEIVAARRRSKRRLAQSQPEA